jgi:hypothetical protein
MSEPLWTPVGEDTGAEVLAIDYAQNFAIGELERYDGTWICRENDGHEFHGVVAYIPLTRLVALSKIKPVAPTEMYRPKRFHKPVINIAKEVSLDGW